MIQSAGDKKTFKDSFKFGVREVGTENPILWTETLEEATAQAAERNQKAEGMGIKARYETYSL